MGALARNRLALRRQNHLNDHETPEMFYLQTRIKNFFSKSFFQRVRVSSLHNLEKDTRERNILYYGKV